MVESTGAAGKRTWNWFTLVTLILVFGILGVLLVAFIGLFQDISNAGKATCASNLYKIGMACQAWAAMHNQQWPYAYSKESERWDDVGNTRSAKGEDLGEKVPVNSNTANMWMLLKAGLVEGPAVFICPNAKIEYSIDDVSDPEHSPIRDFRSGLACSYSFQNVFQGVREATPPTGASSPSGTVAIDADAAPAASWT